MKASYAIALALGAGLALGAAAIHGLHAQAKPPAYVIVEAVITDNEGYLKEFVPAAGKAAADFGAKYLVRGGATVSLVGSPPPPRFVLLQFESMDKAQGWWDSPARKESQAIGDKFALFRIFAAEGVAP
jgi:uncharacterized protein (DUF1330 family)